jgi:hypothetical protein
MAFIFSSACNVQLQCNQYYGSTSSGDEVGRAFFSPVQILINTTESETLAPSAVRDVWVRNVSACRIQKIPPPLRIRRGPSHTYIQKVQFSTH